jgi:hypothetical protein
MIDSIFLSRSHRRIVNSKQVYSPLVLMFCRNNLANHASVGSCRQQDLLHRFRKNSIRGVRDWIYQGHKSDLVFDWSTIEGVSAHYHCQFQKKQY